MCFASSNYRATGHAAVMNWVYHRRDLAARGCPNFYVRSAKRTLAHDYLLLSLTAMPASGTLVRMKCPEPVASAFTPKNRSAVAIPRSPLGYIQSPEDEALRETVQKARL